MSIESLLIRQAQLSDLRRELKAKGCDEASKCSRQQVSINDHENCISWAFQCFKDDVAEAAFNHCGGPEFDEVWDICVSEGEVCQHCQNVRALKKQRMRASRELGGVRAAITKVGRRLAKEG